jgi:hypothetical protein
MDERRILASLQSRGPPWTYDEGGGRCHRIGYRGKNTTQTAGDREHHDDEIVFLNIGLMTIK